MVEGAQEPTGESGIGVRSSPSKTRAGVINPGVKHHPELPTQPGAYFRADIQCLTAIPQRNPPLGRASRQKSTARGGLRSENTVRERKPGLVQGPK